MFGSSVQVQPLEGLNLHAFRAPNHFIPDAAGLYWFHNP